MRQKNPQRGKCHDYVGFVGILQSMPRKLKAATTCNFLKSFLCQTSQGRKNVFCGLEIMIVGLNEN